jgi:serine/threonine protein kinase
MQQLLRGLDHCHSRGVLHRDIKGSNLLIDNNGILKIADFGLASFYDPAQVQPLTSRVVTLWYRPPELLLGATYYGIAVDLWSTGCILAELYAGKPIMPGRTEVLSFSILETKKYILGFSTKQSVSLRCLLFHVIIYCNADYFAWAIIPSTMLN